jgi:hypothetical protein
MPRENELPDSIKDLAFRDNTEIRPGRDLIDHLNHLVQGLQRLFETQAEAPYKAEKKQTRTEGSLLSRLSYTASQILSDLTSSCSGSTTKDQAPGIRKGEHMAARIFLCHASEDKAQVREVYHRLRAIDGFEPWLDEEDLLPGQDWTREIPRALQASDFILVFFSRTSVAKHGYVQREMKLALDALQEIPEGAIHTIPVRLDDCEVPESFRHYHYANLFEPSGFDRIVRAIHAELAKRFGATPPPSPQPSPRPSLPEGPAAQDTAVELLEAANTLQCVGGDSEEAYN